MRVEIDRKTLAAALRCTGTGNVALHGGGNAPVLVSAVEAPRFAVVTTLRI